MYLLSNVFVILIAFPCYYIPLYIPQSFVRQIELLPRHDDHRI
jgi:hypothetical protein